MNDFMNQLRRDLVSQVVVLSVVLTITGNVLMADIFSVDIRLVGHALLAVGVWMGLVGIIWHFARKWYRRGEPVLQGRKPLHATSATVTAKPGNAVDVVWVAVDKRSMAMETAISDVSSWSGGTFIVEFQVTEAMREALGITGLAIVLHSTKAE